MAAETVFPWSLVEETFDILQGRDARFLRYRDLSIESSFCRSRFRYCDEYVHFRTGSKAPWAAITALAMYAGIRWPNLSFRLRDWAQRRSSGLQPPTILMQHDADLLPEKTCEMLDLEYRRGIVSSAYVFVEHPDDSGYVLDTDKLRSLEEKGFEIGYHQNALERAEYDHELALELVEQDLKWLRKHFTITSFVPHGGEPSSDGQNNEHLGHKGALKSLLWAYNGNCILKDYTWSDGGIKKRAPSDPRLFAGSLVRGSRAMMLMHPQYYGNVLRDDWRSLPISNEKWWRDLWGL